MSRLIKKPIEISQGVEVVLQGKKLEVKSNGKVTLFDIPSKISVVVNKDSLMINKEEGFDIENANSKEKAMFGTLYSNIRNAIIGFSKGFEKKLTLIGVGYKVQVTGNDLVLNVGFSHPIKYKVPNEVKVSSPSVTELLLSSFDKAKLGQVASEIRSFRPPEPYQGKGIRYSDEVVFMKEAKKK